MNNDWSCVLFCAVHIIAIVVTSVLSATIDIEPSPVARVTEGSVLWLTCTYDLTGGTLGQLQWLGNDGGIVATVTPTAVTPCLVQVTGYNIDCDNLASSEVRLGIQSPVHGDTYSCTIYLADTTFTQIGPVSTQVSIVVPVPSVTFTSPVSGTVTVTPGGSQVYSCVTGSCRPPARIDWYKDGVNVTTRTGSVSSTGDKFVTTSSLTLTGSKGDTAATVQCRASNVDGMSAVVSGDKTFVVEWPPDGPPVISGYTQTTILYPNDTVTLQCKQPGGNPIATLTWSGVCGGIPTTNSDTATEAVSDITITVTKGYNQATCSCVSAHPQQSQDTTQVTFTVHYAPDKNPVITGYRDGQILYEGTPDLSLTCTQEGGNPLATITWDCVGQTGTTVGGSTTQTTSTVQVPRDRNNNQKSCSCTARSPDTRIITVRTVSVIFTVYYAPLATQLPHITGYTPGDVLYEGDPVRSVECHQAGGFPLANLNWNCLSLSSTDTSTDSESISTIQLSSDRTYNGRNCTCTSTHPDSNVLYSKAVYVTITVYYPPSKPVLTQTPTHPWLAGGSGTLMCHYTEGFPAPAKIQWYRDWNLQTGQSASTLTLTSLVHTDDRVGYFCRVSNAFTETKHTDLVSSSTNLNVEYKPRVTLTTTQLTVVEGKNVQVSCKAIGNPTPTLQWLRGGLTILTGNGTSLDLSFKNVDRSATDNYTCHAEGVSTVQGRQLVTEEITKILVQYPPVVSVIVPLTVKEGDTDVRVMCHTTGEPNTLVSQSWTQTIDQSFITDRFTYETAAHDTIVLSEVSLEDTGTYTCSVSNGIADRQERTLQSNSTVLDVIVAAKFNISRQYHEIFGQLYEPLTVKIPFYSNPPVRLVADLEWTQLTNGNHIKTSGDITFNLQNDNPINLSIKGRTIMFSGQTAVMSIRAFDQSFVGNYTITVYNDGRSRHSTASFLISPFGYPKKPMNFRVTDYTSSSITVEWTKNFNGGNPQTFVIIYGIVGGSHFQSVSVSEQELSTYSKTITNLKPDNRYQLNMYAYNDVGNSSLSSGFAIIGKTHPQLQVATSSQYTASIVLFVIASLMVIASVLIVCVIYRRNRTGKPVCGGGNDMIKSDGNQSTNQTGEHGHLNEGSHYDELNLTEREPQSSYERIMGNTTGNTEASVPNNDRLMYESLGERERATEYEELKGSTRCIYENTEVC